MNDAVAFVLARGGSKRVPRKNVRLFHGKPMVAWPVFHAMRSDLFSSVIISTDDREIADAAVAEGAVFFGPRPNDLSNDYATTADVLAHELDEHESRTGNLPTVCCCLYGTSAFISVDLLRQGRAYLDNQAVEMVMTVSAYGHPIERALIFNATGNVDYRTPEFALARTQDIPISYYDTGLMCWFKTDALRKKGRHSFLPLQKTAVAVPDYLAVDIDTEDDWLRAELLAKICGERPFLL